MELLKNKYDYVLKELNEEQVIAAKHKDGPALIVATAGSGKTRVLINRAQYMILNGVNPYNILMTTFTKKAAGEMKSRIVNIVGDIGKSITVGTYHSICTRILRKYHKEIFFIKNFSILDSDDSEKIIKEVAKEINTEWKHLQIYIHNCKKRCITPAKALEDSYKNSDNALARGYRRYQDYLISIQSMDFDDLLLNTVKLLQDNPDIKKQINNRWQYISADEIQDSSKLDSTLLHLLAGDKQNIMMVGDDSQSIYKFRGSDVKLMLNLKDKYPNLKTYTLSINYRSTSNIINAAQSVINNNSANISKDIKCGSNIVGSPIMITQAKTKEHEATIVANYINIMKNKYNIPYNEMAILYRSLSCTAYFERALLKERIPYKIMSGVPFYCRTEIKDILSYARLTVNEYDVIAFERTVNIPKKGIGEKTLSKIRKSIQNNAINNKSSIVKLILEDKIDTSNARVKKGLTEYKATLKKILEYKTQLKPKEFIEKIIELTDYYEYLKTTYTDTYISRIENVKTLLDIAKDFNNIEDVLDEQALTVENDESEDEVDAVNLLTMHKSKGLEYDTVFMTNMYEGSCPSFYSLGNDEDIEEERRLAFVGYTRAKRNLFITYSTQPTYGSTCNRPSRFINEIDNKYKRKIR